MALRFFDGFDTWSGPPYGYQKGWSTLGNVGTSTSPVPNGYGRCAQQANNGGSTLGVVLDNQPTWIVGFNYFQRSSDTLVLQLFDGGTSQMEMRWNTSANLTITRNGTLLATSSLTYSYNTWYYIEFAVTIHPTSGTAEVHVNNELAVSFAGNTRTSANSFASNIQIALPGFGGAFGPNGSMDDFYICDGTGSRNNTFLGPVRCEAMYPAVDTTPQQYTPSTGTTHFSLVSDAPTDSDTSYVASTTANDGEVYNVYNSTSGALAQGAIASVNILSFSRMDDATTRRIGHQMVIGGTEYDTSVNAGMSSNYSLQISPTIDTNPATSAQWIYSDMLTAKFGVKTLQ